MRSLLGKLFEFDAGTLGRELAVDFGLKAVAASPPGGGFTVHDLDVVDAPFQLLNHHNANFGACP